MEIIKSNKGCYKGYVYVVKHIGISKITWMCSSKRCSMKCTGELYTDLKIENPEVKTGQSRLKDDDSVKVEKALCAMKERSKTDLSNSHLKLMRQKFLSWTVTLERRCQWKTMLKEL
ncbi:unnamed protein product [Macrosiphum euphorbiae]|uniref:FLYWCH-type domain-containing protein n=1 Tax=Macrosiphum euphorbiae TaxID=13131 RepID=A0AAV0W806_9HEMI|nr:unnamed protein product [Macrosiphum euphorbiae]